MTTIKQLQDRLAQAAAEISRNDERMAFQQERLSKMRDIADERDLALADVAYWRARAEAAEADNAALRARAGEWRRVGKGEPPGEEVFEVRTLAQIADNGNGPVIFKAPWGGNELSGGNQLCWWILGNDWQWRPALQQDDDR